MAVIALRFLDLTALKTHLTNPRQSADLSVRFSHPLAEGEHFLVIGLGRIEFTSLESSFPEFVNEMDADNNGEISFGEFINYYDF